MSTTPNVPYRLEFSVEVPGTPEQVWQAIATAKGMSAWFLPTEMQERQGGSLHFTMGPEMGSDGQVTGWDPPRRLVYEEDWAALMGKDPDALSPLTSEFLVQAQSGGTCIVRVTSSGFGTGEPWESEFWDDMGPNWMLFFDNLRLYLSHFPGQEATQLEVTASHPDDAEALWSRLHTALGLGEEGATITVRGSTGTVERVGKRQALVRLSAPVPGILSVFAHGEGDGKATAGVRAYLLVAVPPEVERHDPAATSESGDDPVEEPATEPPAVQQDQRRTLTGVVEAQLDPVYGRERRHDYSLLSAPTRGFRAESFLDEQRPYMELKRRGEPEEVANVIVFLCSERASFVNGSNYRVDSGSVATI